MCLASATLSSLRSDMFLGRRDPSRSYYWVLGKSSLVDAGEWQYPTNALHRFFKISVEMP